MGWCYWNADALPWMCCAYQRRLIGAAVHKDVGQLAATLHYQWFWPFVRFRTHSGLCSSWRCAVDSDPRGLRRLSGGADRSLGGLERAAKWSRVWRRFDRRLDAAAVTATKPTPGGSASTGSISGPDLAIRLQDRPGVLAAVFFIPWEIGRVDRFNTPNGDADLKQLRQSGQLRDHPDQLGWLFEPEFLTLA